MYELKRCVLLADDEERIVRALRDLLSSNGFFVLTALSGREALEQFGRYSEQIDLVLLDVMMPEGDGFSVLREIRAASSLVPVVMLTARGEEYDQLQGLQDGADDYIAKPFSVREVLARVKSVLRRTRQQTPAAETIGYDTLRIDMERKICTLDGTEVKLTKKEFEILALFLKNPGKIFSREEILRRVWSDEVIVLDRTIDVNITRLRRKIGPYGEHVVTRLGYGYGFEA